MSSQTLIANTTVKQNFKFMTPACPSTPRRAPLGELAPNREFVTVWDESPKSPTLATIRARAAARGQRTMLKDFPDTRQSLRSPKFKARQGDSRMRVRRQGYSVGMGRERVDENKSSEPRRLTTNTAKDSLPRRLFDCGDRSTSPVSDDDPFA